MPDDIELLRLRAKAKLKLRQTQQSQEQSTPQERPFWDNANQILPAGRMMQRGSIVGGAAKAGNAALGMALSPIAIGEQKLRQGINSAFATNPAERGVANLALDALGLIPRVGGAIGEGLTKAGLGYAGALLGPNLGTSPQNATDIYREVPKLGETVGSVALAEPLMKGAGKVVTPIADAVGKAVETKVQANRLQKVKEEAKFVAPPKAKELTYDQNQNVWLQYMKEQDKRTPIDRSSPQTAVRQVTDMTQEAMNNLWNEKIAPINNQFGNGKIVNGGAVSQKLINNIKNPVYANMFKPEQVQLMIDNANKLNKQLSAKETVDIIKGMNADLSGYYKKTPSEQAVIDNKFGGVSGLKEIRDALAQEYFDKMEAFGVKGMRQARLDFGSLSSMHDALGRNIVRAEKVEPPAQFHGLRTSLPYGAGVVGGILAESMTGNLPVATATGLGSYALTNYMKNRATPNATILRMMGRLAETDLPKPASPSYNPNIAGALSSGPIVTPPPNPPSNFTNQQPYIHYGVPSQQRALPSTAIVPPVADATRMTNEQPFIQYGVPKKQTELPRGAIRNPQGQVIEVQTPNGRELHYFDDNGNFLYSINISQNRQ